MSAAPLEAVEKTLAEGPPRISWGVKTFVLTLVFVGVLAGLGIYQVWHRYQLHSLGIELSTETIKYRSMLEDNRKLRLELATLKRVERIRREAHDRLGMRVPAPQDVVEIR